jgi:hypothetical protein
MKHIDGEGMVLAVCLVLCMAWLVSALIRYRRNWKRVYQSRVASRKNLSKAEFLQSYYAKQSLNGEDIWTIVSRLAELYRVSPGQLRPSDSFFKELAPPDSVFHGERSSYLALSTLIAVLEREWHDRCRFVEKTEHGISSLGDLIAFFAVAMQRFRENA